MKSANILETLGKHQGEFVSGERLARLASVSRAAVWKRVNRLRAAGYRIEASTKLGYRLLAYPELLDPDALSGELTTGVIGARILHFPEVDSTNEKAKELAVGGCPEGTIVLAERQLGGKGRLGRSWFSPPGGVWLSFVLRPRIAASDTPKIMMLAAAAVTAAVRSLGLRAVVKWPNDILIGEKKVAGVLTEMAGQPDLIDHLIVGVGLNANIPSSGIPEELSERATSLQVELGYPVDRFELVKRLIEETDRRYAEFAEGSFVTIFDEWRSACTTLGREVELSTALREVVSGVAIDVDENGSLILELDDGSMKTFAAGDVTIKK